jgi:gamma-Tubulin ring complex non-core subunit mod21
MGREDLAEPLERLLPDVLSQDLNTEILTLLLALSDKPVDMPEFDESKYVVEPIVQKQITWEDILAEDPFVGDHWKMPSYSDSDDDEDWTYEAESHVILQEPVVQPVSNLQINMDVSESKQLDALFRRQYWLHRRKVLVRPSSDVISGGISFTVHI